MKDPKELRAKAKILVDAAEKMMTDAGDEALTEEQRTAFDAKLAESDKLLAEAKTIEDIQARQAALATSAGRQTTPTTDTEARTREVEITARPRQTCVLGREWGVNDVERRENAHTAGQFLVAHLTGAPDAVRWCNEHGIAHGAGAFTQATPQQRALGTTIGATAGVLVPDQYSATLIALMNDYGDAMGECRVVPIGPGTNYVPRRTSGTTTYFIAENTAATESEPAVDSVALTAKDAITLTRIHDNLITDSVIDTANWIASEHALSLATKMDQCVIDGDGTSTFGGMHGIRTKMVDGNHAASYNDATAGDDQWAEYLLADIQGIEGLLPNWAYKRGNVKWHVSRVCFHETFRRLLSALGGNAWPDVVAGGGGVVSTFLGFPVKIWDAMPTASTALDQVVVMLFGNMMDSTTIGIQGGTMTMETPHRYFEFRQIGFRTTTRFDINVHDIGDASNAGAVVALRGNTS